ncbi:hypothetical protein DL93DRAFT_2071445 [Clavulina sp. PMI_390]|nr:hypothetical protein DL93DRAFT_2071445 [Clavulina sp. PMI_390]
MSQTPSTPSLAAAVTVQSINIGGLSVDVFSGQPPSLSNLNGNIANDSQPPSSIPQLPLAALILLHGRLGSKADLHPIAEKILSYAHDRSFPNGSPSQRETTTTTFAGRELIVVTLDHRNHGARTVDPFSNQSWSTRPEKHNPRHAIDMYAIQTGSAHDVSYLIDALPDYLFPNGERTIDTWAMSGVSLGGHSTWHCLKEDPRIKIGVPIIGGSASASPHFNRNTTLPGKYDPTSPTDRAANPFLGKHVLVLSGGKDKLVPYTFSRAFVDSLVTGEDGSKDAWVQPEAGHELTDAMLERLCAFIWEKALCAPLVIGLQDSPSLVKPQLRSSSGGVEGGGNSRL